jgi:penicillin-insensitive murein endopeptidase
MRFIPSTALLFGCLLSVQPLSASNSPWAKIKHPISGEPQVIGAVANGCISGAQTLAETGPGYVSIRRHRNRFYSHPNTIRLVQELGASQAKEGKQLIMIGDLSQPRGGIMSSMHRSHQNGLDVDIWLTLTDSVESAKVTAPDGQDPPSMLTPDNKSPNEHWGPTQIRLIRTVAERPEVDRIFVNGGIKKALCDSQPKDSPWLAKVRPWWGHNSHFHVRLKCPEGSPKCEPQKAYPPGNGCGKELADWIRPPFIQKKPDPTQPPKPEPPPPAVRVECKPILSQNDKPVAPQVTASPAPASTAESKK